MEILSFSDGPHAKFKKVELTAKQERDMFPPESDVKICEGIKLFLLDKFKDKDIQVTCGLRRGKACVYVTPTDDYFNQCCQLVRGWEKEENWIVHVIIMTMGEVDYQVAYVDNGGGMDQEESFLKRFLSYFW